MKHHNDNIFDNTTFEFPRAGFWLVRLLGALAIFAIGMKIGERRSLTVPGMAFNFLRMIMARR